jgi:hypothetical protein
MWILEFSIGGSGCLPEHTECHRTKKEARAAYSECVASGGCARGALGRTVFLYPVASDSESALAWCSDEEEERCCD